MSERDNRCRWTGQPGHYEVWYLTCNRGPDDTGYWIRYTLEAPLDGHGEPYAQLWFARFDAKSPERNLAVNQVFPITAWNTSAEPFAVTIGPGQLTNGSARGRIVGAASPGTPGGPDAGSGAGPNHEVSWDLRWTPALWTHHHLPGLMYRRAGLSETTVLSPNLDVDISGTITCDGETVELRGEPGGQTHLWGRKHAHAWAWGHCNNFAGRRSAALETLSVQLKRLGRELPRLTIFTLYLDGEIYRFTEFHHTLLTRARWSTGRYSFAAYSPTVRILGEFRCRPEDMVVAPYVDPDGAPSYCANTEVGDLDITVHKRRGILSRWSEFARLTAPRRGHFEIGGRERDPRVAADHLTVSRSDEAAG
ncbi:MAG: tocopherol cyclase family protein [Myxococcota bacterium]